MALDPENYINVYVSLARAMFEQQIPIVVAAELAHFSAQPATEVAIHDVLDELKAELYDWIPSDLNALGHELGAYARTSLRAVSVSAT